MSERIGGLGFELGLSPKADSKGKVQWVWSLKRFGRELASGLAETREEGESAAWAAFRQNHESGRGNKEIRKAWKVKLKNHLGKRPYLVAGIVTGVYAGWPKEQIISQSSEMEQTWAAADPEDVRVPIPTHHLALKPEQAAKQVLDAMVALGLTKEEGGVVSPTSKLKPWSIKHFGKGFFE